MNIALLQQRLSEKDIQQLLIEFPQMLFLPLSDVQYKALPPEKWAQVEVIFGNRLTAEELLLCPKLRWIHSPNPNLNRLCLADIAQRANLILTMTPEENIVQVGEYVLGALLAYAKNLFAWKEVGRFPQSVWDSKWRDSLWSLQNRVFVQIGFNLASLEIVRRASQLSMKVIGVEKTKTFHPYCHENASFDDLESILPQADVVCLCLPKGADWEQWFDQKRLLQMKDDSILIIIGSHKVVDEDALHHLATSGKFRGIILDAFYPTPIPLSSAIWKIPNILITPDVAPRPKSRKSQAFSLFRYNLRQYLHGNFGDMK